MEAMLHIWLLRLVLLALVVGSLRPGGAFARLSRGLTPATRWRLVGIVLLSATLRLIASQWSVVHQNAHGYMTYGLAATLNQLGPRGSAGLVLYNAGLLVGPDAPHTILVVNFLLSSLAPVFGFFAARAWFRSDGSGLLAAVLIATNPIHIRLSAAEALLVPEFSFALLAMALVAGFVRDRDMSPLPAAFAIVMATQCRTLGFLHLPAFLLMVLVGWKQIRGRRGLRFVGAVFVVLVATGFQLFWQVSQIQSEGMPGYTPSLLVALSSLVDPAANVALDPASSPALLWICVLAGGAWLARHRPAVGAPLLVGLLLTALMHAGFSFNAEDRLRHHLPVLAWLVFLGGAGFLVLERHAKAAVLRGAWVGVLALSALGLWQNEAEMTRRFNTQHEYAVLERTPEILPKGAAVVYAGDRFADSGIIGRLPNRWLAGSAGIRSFVRAERWLDGTWRPDSAYWFQGLACWTYDTDELERLRARAEDGRVGMRPVCQRMLETPGLRPLWVEKFPSRPDGPVTAAESVFVGFYKLP